MSDEISMSEQRITFIPSNQFHKVDKDFKLHKDGLFFTMIRHFNAISLQVMVHHH
jgi:hypothetical protein